MFFMESMEKLWQILLQGGDIVFVLLAVSVIGTAFFFYCLLIMRKNTLFPNEIVGLTQTLTRESDFIAAEGVLRKTGGPLAEIIITVIMSRDLSRDEADTLVEGAGRRSAHAISKGVLALEVIAAISPLLGLLGTVTGMYTVFGKISQVGVGEVHKLSGGIAEALVTTIVGLVIGIPAYVAFSYFARKADEMVMEMERLAVGLMLRIR